MCVLQAGARAGGECSVCVLKAGAVLHVDVMGICVDVTAISVDVMAISVGGESCKVGAAGVSSWRADEAVTPGRSSG